MAVLYNYDSSISWQLKSQQINIINKYIQLGAQIGITDNQNNLTEIMTWQIPFCQFRFVHLRWLGAHMAVNKSEKQLSSTWYL